MAGEPYFITTAISYPNGVPHIGHAYEVIAADAIARFKRLDGYDVFFTTGTDEHGLKIQQTAAKAGISPRAFVDDYGAALPRHGRAARLLVRPLHPHHDADHIASAQALWRRMEENGDIYLAKYAGWYSVRDEAYYDESELVTSADGSRRAEKTGTPVEWVEEESYFFRLSAYGERLLALYEANRTSSAPIRAATRYELRPLRPPGFIRQPHHLRLGVPVPGNPAHVMYVWVDALTNYITSCGFPDEGDPRWRHWPADLHVIGKDIIRFHAVYWPAFLMSAGLPVPKRVFGHGFLLNKGEKMSKSVGNVVDPVASPTSTASIPCATSCCARCRSARTAATRTRRSSTGSMPTSPTTSATSPSAR